MERTSNKKKVSRQRSLCRRSNCSKRSETGVRSRMPDDERLSRSEPVFWSWLMNGRPISGDYKLANIVRTVLTATNTSNRVAFLTGTCEHAAKQNRRPQDFSGAPEFVLTAIL